MPNTKLIKKIKNGHEDSRKLNYSFYLKENKVSAFKEKCRKLGLKPNNVLDALITNFNEIKNSEF